MDRDLEKTRALNELNELNELANIEEEKEVNIPDNINDSESKEDLYSNLVDENKEEKENKPSLKDKWNNLSKRNKVFIIIGTIIILIIIIALIIFLLNKKDDKKEDPYVENVVLAKDNYIYENGILTIYNDNEEVLGSYECINKNENLCYVAYNSNSEDSFAISKNIYEDGSVVKERSKVYLNRYVFIYDNASDSDLTIKLYDMLNNKILNEYTLVKNYNVENDNIAVVKNENNLYGLIELNESGYTNLIDLTFDYMGIIDKDDDKYIVVKDKNGYYLVDYNGKTKTRAFSGEIIDYNNEYIIVKKANNKYSTYSYSGEEELKDYDYISIINDNYLAVVIENNLYIRGYSDNKYNEEGYELTNTNYNKVNTFDSNNKIISTSYAYDFELHDYTLTIKLLNSDNTTRREVLNLKEGELSTKLDYYSYLNGKLYFYEDQEKTKIIGTYECRNKNNLDNDTFSNCNIAKDSMFSDNYITPHVDKDTYIPLFNKRYIFILDAPTLQNDSNKEIKFYDLKDSKVLGTYLEIDANTENNINSLVFKDTNDTKIIAKLKSGKFGVININNSDASVDQRLSFNNNFNNIERANNDFIVQLDNNNYEIIYGDADYTSAEFPGKIMNYKNNHLVIKNDDKVYIYNADVSLNNKNGYDYIDISNKEVYGAVINNKLSIYTYDGEKVNDEDITLDFNTYYNSNNVAFKLSVNGNVVTAQIYKENGVLDSSKTKSFEIKKVVEETNNKEEVDKNEE